MKIQKKTNRYYFLENTYNLQPLYINVIHKNSRKKRTNIYGLMYICIKKTLGRATTDRAMEIYQGRFSHCIPEWQDLLQDTTIRALYGYTDLKGKYHKGYFTDRIATADQIMLTAYSAVNASLYAKKITGLNLGVEQIGINEDQINIIADLFGKRQNNITYNTKKYNVFIQDVLKNVKTIYLNIVQFIIENTQYINVKDGTIQRQNVAYILDISEAKVRRAYTDFKSAIDKTLIQYNMNKAQFVQYIQAG